MKRASLHSFLSLATSATLLLLLFGCGTPGTSEVSFPADGNGDLVFTTDGTTETSAESAATTTTTAETTTTSTTSATTTTTTTQTTAATTTTAAETPPTVSTTEMKTSTTTAIQEKPYRVVCVQEDGIVIDLYDSGYVLVMLDNTHLEIGPLRTVMMVFTKNDLLPANGTFRNFDGKELRYSYVLKNPKSIRLAAAGEPTFG